MAHSSAQGPSYYKRGGIDVWDFIREQGLNFHLGNAIKYICRAGYKESKISDLRKAIHYLQNELENEIIATGTSPTIPNSIQSEQQSNGSFPQYAEEFDR